MRFKYILDSNTSKVTVLIKKKKTIKLTINVTMSYSSMTVLADLILTVSKFSALKKIKGIFIPSFFIKRNYFKAVRLNIM